MNIYISHSDNPKIIGLAQSMIGLENPFFWSTDNPPIFDLMEGEEDKKPDIMFLSTKDILKSKISIVKDYHPELKVVWLKEDESKLEKELYESLDLVIDLVNKDAETFLAYLINHIHINGEKNSLYESDFVIFNDNLDVNNTKFLQVCDSIGYNFRLKIYGPKQMRSPFYLGLPKPSDYKDIFKSNKAIILFDDRWFYTAIKNETIPLVFKQPKATKTWEFSTYTELHDLCQQIISSDAEKIKTELAKVDLSNKTYKDFYLNIKEKLV